MSKYTAVLRAHITVTIDADDRQEFFRKLSTWRNANRAKAFGRTTATVTMVPGMPVVALDHEHTPIARPPRPDFKMAAAGER